MCCSCHTTHIITTTLLLVPPVGACSNTQQQHTHTTDFGLYQLITHINIITVAMNTLKIVVLAISIAFSMAASSIEDCDRWAKEGECAKVCSKSHHIGKLIENVHIGQELEIFVAQLFEQLYDIWQRRSSAVRKME
jgi:hypothetical protein